MKAQLLALLACMAMAGDAVAKPPQNDQEREAAVQALQWHDGEELTLPQSNGTLKASPPVRQLLGADARSLFEVVNGVDAPAGLEATLLDPRTRELVLYQKARRLCPPR